MTWTNAFDVGPCTVKVSPQNFSGGFDAPMWSGALTKGETSPTFTDTLTNEDASVSVDADGAVSFTTAVNNGYIYALDVVPSYSVGGSGIRARTMAVVLDHPPGFASNLASAEVALDVGGTGLSVTPDPVTLTGTGAAGWRVANGQGTE